MLKTQLKRVALITSLLVSSSVMASSGAYNTDIPSSIMTPDKVETSIGTLNFKDGVPSQQTMDTLYDNLDTMRATEVFMNAIPMASMEALRVGHEKMGLTSSNQVMLFDDLMDSNPLFLTGNTDTVYASAFLDLERDGPTVVEIPPGMGPTTVNDAFFRFVTDMGVVGQIKVRVANTSSCHQITMVQYLRVTMSPNRQVIPTGLLRVGF